MAVIGFIIAITAIGAAVLGHWPYWYTPFTIGSFLFFDRLAQRLTGYSTTQLIARQGWRTFVLVYLSAAGVALVVDVVYGRMLANAWIYPPWQGLANLAVPVLFHYPFGMLSLYATFQTWRGVLDTASPRTGNLPGWYGPASILGLALCVVAPLLNFWLNANRGEGELLFIVMLVSTVAFDGVRDALTGNSILRELVAQGRRYVAALVITLAWAVILNEGPNVFAREWIYTIRPFGLPLWLILILGWPFLLSVSVAVYETTSELIVKRGFKNLVRMEAGNANDVIR